MNTKAIIVLTVIVCSILGLNAGAFGVPESSSQQATSEKQEYHVHGEQTVISVSNNWITNDPEQRRWVVDIPGVPEEIYVIDQEAREEIYHYKTVHHKAKTHKENKYGTRLKTIITYDDWDGIRHKVSFYDPTSSDYLGLPGTIVDITTKNERYIISSKTVVDREAYDEEVKVIDQPAQEEIGHYETIIVGEVGHYENLTEIETGKGDGHFEAVVSRRSVAYQE